MLSRTLPAAVLLLAVQLLRADFTMGYEVSVSVPAWVPAELAKQLKEGVKTRLPEFLTLQARGDKGFFGTSKFKVIVDYSKQEVTIIEPAARRFATVAMKDYPAAVRAAMPEIPTGVQQVLEPSRAKFAINKTGRRDNILGLPAEEYEAVFSIDPPPALASKYHDAIAKTVLRLWITSPEDLTRIGVSYYMDRLQWLTTNMNLVVLTQLGLGGLPGGGREFTAAIDQLTRENALVVQAELDLYAPTIGMVEQEMARKETSASPPLSNLIIAEIVAELGGLSFDPIEDADLSVPVGFVKVTPLEILSKPVQPATR
jgi:hypothetical protein